MLFPCRIRAFVMPGNLEDDRHPGLWPHGEFICEALPEDSATAVELERAENHSKLVSDLLEEVHAINGARRPGIVDWLGTGTESVSWDELGSQMPATRLALGWLLDDMKDIGMLKDGSFGKLQQF